MWGKKVGIRKEDDRDNIRWEKKVKKKNDGRRTSKREKGGEKGKKRKRKVGEWDYHGRERKWEEEHEILCSKWALKSEV